MLADVDILYGDLDLAEGMTGLNSNPHTNHRPQQQPHAVDDGDEEQDFVSMVPAAGGPVPQHRGATNGQSGAAAVRGKRQWLPDGMPPLELPAGTSSME